MMDYIETRIKISGEDVLREDLKDQCSGFKETTVELAYNGYGENIKIEFPDIDYAFILPKEKLKDILQFFDAQIEKDNKLMELEKELRRIKDHTLPLF